MNLSFAIQEPKLFLISITCFLYIHCLGHLLYFHPQSAKKGGCDFIP